MFYLHLRKTSWWSRCQLMGMLLKNEYRSCGSRGPVDLSAVWDQLEPLWVLILTHTGGQVIQAHTSVLSLSGFPGWCCQFWFGVSSISAQEEDDYSLHDPSPDATCDIQTNVNIFFTYMSRKFIRVNAPVSCDSCVILTSLSDSCPTREQQEENITSKRGFGLIQMCLRVYMYEYMFYIYCTYDCAIVKLDYYLLKNVTQGVCT